MGEFGFLKCVSEDQGCGFSSGELVLGPTMHARFKLKVCMRCAAPNSVVVADEDRRVPGVVLRLLARCDVCRFRLLRRSRRLERYMEVRVGRLPCPSCDGRLRWRSVGIAD